MFVEKVIPFQYGVGRWVSGCEARCVERMRGEVVQTCFVSWLAALSRGSFLAAMNWGTDPHEPAVTGSLKKSNA